MVPADSHKIPRVPCYLGVRSEKKLRLSPTGLAPSVARLSRTVRLDEFFVTSRPYQHLGPIRSHNTDCTTRAGLHAIRFRLFPVRSPLLRKSWLLSLPEATKMVQFASLARRIYVFNTPSYGFAVRGFPIRKSPGQGLFAPYRSLSQLATSFIAYQRQGIRHTPLVT